MNTHCHWIAPLVRVVVSSEAMIRAAQLLTDCARRGGHVLTHAPEDVGDGAFRDGQAATDAGRICSGRRSACGASGKPTDNAFVESFNGCLRDECLNAHWFLSITDARGKIQAWRRDCNESRPHTSLGWMTPVEYAAAAAAKAAE